MHRRRVLISGAVILLIVVLLRIGMDSSSESTRVPIPSTADAAADDGKRFSCEENFRDIKDTRFGMGFMIVATRAQALHRMSYSSAVF